MEKAYHHHLCSEEFYSLDKLSAAVECRSRGGCGRKRKKVKCNVCGCEFSSGSYLMVHIRTHTGERPFKCSVSGCGMTCKQEQNLAEHIKHKHSDERPLKCEFPGCLHTSKTAASMFKHKKVHSNERPFPCPHIGCIFRAKRRDQLKCHVKSVHSEAKAFACPKCSYRTSRSDSLKLHIHRLHYSKKDFKCNHPQCTESFKTLSDLKRHCNNRHGERNVLCDHPGCGQKFTHSRGLRKHSQDVHTRKRHTYLNLNYNYSTNTEGKFAEHMTAHDMRNEKNLCSTEDVEHKGEQTKAGKEVSKNPSRLHKPRTKPYECPLCFKGFQTRQFLQRHCAVHTKEKPFKCGHCEYETSRPKDVKTHIASVHAGIEFPSIVHLLNDRECLRCKVTLSTPEFLVHSKGHESSVVL